MSFPINDDKILEKQKTIWAKVEDLQKIKLDALPFYDDRYTKSKTRASGDKVYTNFRSLNVPEDGVDCESFIVIPIHSLLIYENKYYLQRIFRQLHL